MSKAKRLKIGKYLRELSIVIIGVAVTLYAGNFISNIKEKKDLRQQLENIYAELEENLEKIEMLTVYYKNHERLQKILIESIDNPKQSNNDSISKYVRIASNLVRFTYKKGAYETFLNSGSMKLLKDRNLLTDITEGYLMLERTKEGHDSYLDLKTQEILKVFGNIETAEVLSQSIDIKKPQYRSLFNFYAGVSVPEIYSKEAKKQIKKVLLNKK